MAQPTDSYAVYEITTASAEPREMPVEVAVCAESAMAREILKTEGVCEKTEL
jgi:hypothetical protein